MESSKKKLLGVLAVAIGVTLALAVYGYLFTGFVIGFIIYAIAVKKHHSRCSTCQSWRTSTEVIGQVGDGDGNGSIRRCLKCHSQVVIDDTKHHRGR